MARRRYNPEFAKWLEAQRAAAGLSITAFAASLDISPTYYRQIREGYMPLTDKVKAMAVAYGADPDEWIRLAGASDDLGGIMGEEVSAPEPDPGVPILGEIDEHGIIGYGPDGPPAMEGALRFALRADAASPGSVIQAGDVLLSFRLQNGFRPSPLPYMYVPECPAGAPKLFSPGCLTGV